MPVKVAYFAPTVLAIDDIPASTFIQVYNLVDSVYNRPELANISNQQIQIFPAEGGVDVSWLTPYLESLCQKYMDIVTQQSGADELNYCKPEITRIWILKQLPGQYQEMHTHTGANLSGTLYVSVPELSGDSGPSDGITLFRLAETKDITRFVMNDTWKYRPTQGTAVIFPSHIPHTVYPWKGTGTRTVLAFDAVLKAKDE